MGGMPQMGMGMGQPQMMPQMGMGMGQPQMMPQMGMDPSVMLMQQQQMSQGVPGLWGNGQMGMAQQASPMPQMQPSMLAGLASSNAMVAAANAMVGQGINSNPGYGSVFQQNP